MTCKTIVLSLNEIESLPALLAFGANLARKFSAHVKGLYIVPAISVYGAEVASPTPAILDGVHIYFKKRQAPVRKQFEEAMKREGLTFDFQAVNSAYSDIASDFVDNVRDADLVVMAARMAKPDDPIEGDLVERVIIGSGRPTLVIPPKFAGELKLDEVLVGWNASRESARAVFDALPFLRKAKRVRLCTVNAATDGTVPAATLADTLARHGLNVVTEKLVSGGRNPGETLLQAARDFGSGLVVMGCYGHSRFAEFIFGGATRHVLRHITVPVLMSH